MSGSRPSWSRRRAFLGLWPDLGLMASASRFPGERSEQGYVPRRAVPVTVVFGSLRRHPDFGHKAHSFRMRGRCRRDARPPRPVERGRAVRNPTATALAKCSMCRGPASGPPCLLAAAIGVARSDCWRRRLGKANALYATRGAQALQGAGMGRFPCDRLRPGALHSCRSSRNTGAAPNRARRLAPRLAEATFAAHLTFSGNSGNSTSI